MKVGLFLLHERSTVQLLVIGFCLSMRFSDFVGVNGVAVMRNGDACVAFRGAYAQGFVPLDGHCLTSYVGLEEVE